MENAGSFAEAEDSNDCRGLANVRKLVERNERLTRPNEPPPENFGMVGIVGAGLMGAAIAARHVLRDVTVVLVDTNVGSLARAKRMIEAELTKAASGHSFHLPVDQLLHAEPNNFELLKSCALVIESIHESPKAKCALYSELDSIPHFRSIIATNTSAITIGRLASGLAAPERFCGLHFCHPVLDRPIVEIVRGPKTAPSTIERLVSHARLLGLMPLIVDDYPGFIINRILMAGLNAALELVTRGVSIEAIDRAMVEFGMAMGPIEMLDEFGLDTSLHIGAIASAGQDQFSDAARLLVALVKNGQLGKKSGGGFYEYPSRGVSRLASSLIEANRSDPAPTFSSHELHERILLPMVFEGLRLLEAGVARDPRDIDLGVVFGLGFPAMRGGPMYWADCLGWPTILERLERWGHIAADPASESLAFVQRFDGAIYKVICDERFDAMP